MIPYAGEIFMHVQYGPNEYVDANVVFGLKIDGQVDELLDYDLNETINNVYRTLTIEAIVDATQAAGIADFISDNGGFDKEITVDTTTYVVVNDPSNYKIDFSLWNGSNARSKIKLKFISGSWS